MFVITQTPVLWALLLLKVYISNLIRLVDNNQEGNHARKADNFHNIFWQSLCPHFYFHCSLKKHWNQLPQVCRKSFTSINPFPNNKF